MTGEHRDSGLRPGDKLSNGIVVAVTEVTKPDHTTMEHGIVLCLLPENEVTPWVTWYFNTNRELESSALKEPKPSAYWGHYASTWLEATADFAKRAKGWPLYGRFVAYVEEGDVPLRNLVKDVDAALDGIERSLNRIEASL